MIKQRHLRLISVFALLMIGIIQIKAQVQIESLDRGLVAVKTGGTNVFLSWRLLSDDPDSIGFNIYRNNTKLNDTVIFITNYTDPNGSADSLYYVRTVLGGIEQESSDTVLPWNQNYLSVPLEIPAGGTTPDGVSYTYNANDCSVGDLDGDGEYEIILKWDP